MGLDWNVELALLVEPKVAPEARLDVEEVSVDVEHGGESSIVLDVTGSATVEAEKAEVWVDAVVETLVDVEVAVPWMSLTK